MVLVKMKETAEAFLGREVSKAVVTVPAYSTTRNDRLPGWKDRGPDVLRIINEPTAAALAYGMDKADGKLIAVFDLGGGTFDVSILEISGGVFEVKPTTATRCRREDFDEELLKVRIYAPARRAAAFLVMREPSVAAFARRVPQGDEHRLSGDRLAMQRLREAAEKVSGAARLLPLRGAAC